MRTLLTTALTLGAAALPIALPAAADAGSAFQVGVKADHTSFELGKKIHLTGHVRPGAAAAGSTVRLQEKYRPNKPWRTVATDQVGRSGRYQLVYKPHTATQREYRVVAPAAKHHGRGVSKKLDVSVYSWRKLTTMQSVNGAGVYPTRKMQINGTAYPDSLAADWYPTGTSVASIEYNLDHLCTALTGTFGLSDASQSGSEATVALEADGTQLYSKAFDLGQSETKTIALDSPLKIHVSSTTMVAGALGYGGIGTPKVYCTGAFGS